MSIFDYPRINVKGQLSINVGTANNDDYSSNVFPSGSPFAGQPIRLFNSQLVQPELYGLDDDEWIKWVQQPQAYEIPPPPSQPVHHIHVQRDEGLSTLAALDSNPQLLLPAEWNYYGDMGLTMMNVVVLGVNDPNKQIPASLMGKINSSQLSFLNRLPKDKGVSTGMMTDVNPEDPTNTQIFADYLSLMTNDEVVFSGKPGKAITRWINFTRNANLGHSNGAAATFQQVVPLSELQGQAILDGLPQQSPNGAALAGIVCRYTIYCPLQKINVYTYNDPDPDSPQNWINAMRDLYSRQGTNPDFVTFQGTIAPWFEGDAISQPVGRYLEPIAFPTPADFKGNSAPGAPMKLPPAMFVINHDKTILSLDCSAVWPDNYTGNYDPAQTGNNPKYSLGDMKLVAKISDNPVKQITIADIDYMDMATNDANGWILDFPLERTQADWASSGKLYISMGLQTIFTENNLFLYSEQSGVYAEQAYNDPNATTDQFRNDGPDMVPISFTGFYGGSKIADNEPAVFKLYYWETTPLQDDDKQQWTVLKDNYQLGSPITFPVGKCGNFLITCTRETDPAPPQFYSAFDPLTNPYINIRVLPNNKDYSSYYVDPSAAEPVGNDQLTFDVIYQEVLRNYYLLYPAMSKVIKLNDPKGWTDPYMARVLAQRISVDVWDQSIAMPRTRDLSDSRRKLLTAWCNKIIYGQS